MRTWTVWALAAVLCGATTTRAQLNSQLDDLEGVGIDEQLGAELPLDTKLRDSSGRTIQVRELFDGRRPVILSLNYSDCPMLCQLQLNGLVDALRQMAWRPGTEFKIASLSINPLETPQRAQQTKRRYVQAYGRPETAAGWHFLTGDTPSIASVANAVGFRFKYIRERQEYAHAAALIICTASGKVSRYLYGVVYDPQTLKLALVEAGEGRIGSTLDRILLYCFHYDAASGRFAPVARRIMRIAAGLTLALLLTALLPIWFKRRKALAMPAKLTPDLQGGRR